ncbi:MAG: beta-N-acetylhexosaminidase [Clostridia bacterium]|nr:beta-N-acetylhexosaminidase [Clostridia bacterium]MBO5315290.1 beta-N-acetylhexosaminidase [Clostridia bacterium]
MKKKTTLGVMLDVSRNAVMNMENLKRYFDVLKKMGYNCVFLYAEDTYEVEGDPYFGYMRGRYSKEEMREMDEYGRSVGIEVIPCIQTLAHLTRISKWNQYVMDTPDILMVDDESTYEFIDRMFKTLSECFTTKRIHVGMDEAHMLGRGKHLDKYGYETVDVLMTRHLDRVCEIAKKYDYELMIWSDMYFRPWNNGDYYIGKAEMPEEYIKALPSNVIPVYWDYYSKDPQRYDDMIYNHTQLSDKTWFAGGAWTWGGFAPHNGCSIKCSPPAIEACKKYGINNIFVTMWGDNGAECSKYSVLPTLFLIAEHVRGNTDEALIKKKFEKLFGIGFDEFLLLDTPNNVALPEDTSNPVCPCKYMLYSDPFVGFPDSTVKLGEGAKYPEYAAALYNVAKKSRKYGYLFDSMAKLCDVLADKYELGVKTRNAYKAGDKTELYRLANEEYTRIEKNLRAFIKAFEKQWMKENKPYGFEVQDARLGGLLYRIGSCKKRLTDYCKGSLDSIPELEEDILKYKAEGESIYLNLYANNVTSCVM